MEMTMGTPEIDAAEGASSSDCRGTIDIRERLRQTRQAINDNRSLQLEDPRTNC